MRYFKTVTLKNGAPCTLRQAGAADAAEMHEVFCRTHAETDYLRTLPEENTYKPAEEEAYFADTEQSDRAIEICAVTDGRIVGSAGIEPVTVGAKTDHRAEFGISILRDYWGLGIGRALTEACIACAKEAGYNQLELDVVADNAAALKLYESVGFEEFGRNPRGFLSRTGAWQTLILMRLVLEE